MDFKKNKKSFSIFFLCFFINMIISFIFYIKYLEELDKQRFFFIEKAKKELEEESIKIELIFRSLYQTIRTISFLPGVKKIDRYGKNFSGDSKKAVQQLFNNAYENISMSEIYILPKSIDPDHIDPITKDLEQPIITFDTFLKDDFDDPQKEVNYSEKPELEEVEIFEYRLMKNQLEFLKEKFPKKSSFEGIKVPAIMGKDVITCDNNEFTKEDFEKKNDAPRVGLVYTVPVYDEQNHYSGAVSAVIRNYVLRDLFKERNYAIINKDYDVLISKNPSNYLLDYISGKDSPSVFSKTIDLNIIDQKKWQLAVFLEEDLFLESESKKNIDLNQIKIQIFIWFFGILLTIILFFLIKKQENVSLKIKDLMIDLKKESFSLKEISQSIDSSSSHLASLSVHQSETIEHAVSGMEEIGAMISQTKDHSEITTLESKSGVEKSIYGKEVVENMVHSVNDIAQSNIKLQEIVEIIDDIKNKTAIINDIAFETKILAFNASIEAARAGGYGRGFSVVAEEVGRLAIISGKAAEDVRNLLETSLSSVQIVVKETGEKVDDGYKNAKICQDSFIDLEKSIQKITNSIEQVSIATKEQNIGVKNANQAMIEMEKAAQENANNAKELAVFAQNLTKSMISLDIIINKMQEVS